MEDQRSSKWAFLIYKDCAPEDYKQALDQLHIPYVLSPWHDKDVNSATRDLKKCHKHGCFYFDSLKSYSQVSELVHEALRAPAHVEVVQSPKGMYDYFIHSDNPEKTQYELEDIESGCGFNLTKFLQDQDADTVLSKVLDLIEEKNITEFRSLVNIVRDKDMHLLSPVTTRSFFFSKYLDSKRNSQVPDNKK